MDSPNLLFATLFLTGEKSLYVCLGLVLLAVYVLLSRKRSMKTFFIGFFLSILVASIYASRTYLLHFYDRYTSPLGEVRLIHKGPPIFHGSERQKGICNRLGIPTPECLVIDAHLTTPQTRDLFVRAINSRCGGGAEGFSAQPIKVLNPTLFFEIMSKNKIFRPKFLTDFSGEDMSCSDIWKLIISQFKEEAAKQAEWAHQQTSRLFHLPRRPFLEEMAIWSLRVSNGFTEFAPPRLENFGDPRTWESEFPEYSFSKRYLGKIGVEDEKKLILLHLFWNELHLSTSQTTPKFQMGAISGSIEEWSLFFSHL